MDKTTLAWAVGVYLSYRRTSRVRSRGRSAVSRFLPNSMEMTHRDILAHRACRVVLRDNRYSRSRSKALIAWLGSEWPPTADIAGRALATLGIQAFDDLLNDVLSQGGPTKADLVWALTLFPETHDRLLPFLRDWL